MSRDRVLLHKLKFDGQGDFDRSRQNSKTVNIAHLDMSSAVAGTNYWSRQTVTATFRGQSVHITRFDMSWAGYGRAHCSDFAQATELNTLPWEVKLNSATNRYEFAGFSTHYRPIDIGVKPADWDTAWQWKYYTKYETNFYWNDSNNVPVTYPRGIQNNTNDTTPYTAWDASTQYYAADDGWEINQIWVTDRLMTFGGWQSFETYGTGSNSAYMCGLVNGYRSLGIRLYADGSNQSNWQYTGGRVGFAQLNTDTKRITNYIGTMNPSSPSGGHVNTYRSNVPFVENAARTKLINESKWSIKTFCRLVAFTLNGVNYIGYLMGYSNPNYPDEPYLPIIYAIEDLNDETLSPWGVEPPPAKDEYKGPTSTPGGGTGTYTDYDDGVDITGVNGGLPFSGYAGGYKTYDLTGNQFGQVIAGIFDGTYNEKMVAQMNTGVVDCYGLAIPATSGSPMDVTILGERIENGSSPINTNIIVSMQEFLDCGYVDISEHFYDSYMDFDPYTKISINIPFIGKYDLPVNDFMYGRVGLKYMQDNYSGDLVAFVVATNQFGDTHIAAMFSGNGKYTVPVSGAAKNNIALTSALNVGGKIVGGMMAGMKIGGHFGPYGAAAGAIIGGTVGTISAYPDLENTAAAPMTGQSMVSFNGNQGWLGKLTPYIEVTRVCYDEPETQGRDKGYPSNTTQIIKEVDGFCVIKNLEVENIAVATEQEKAEIILLLSKGIYVDSVLTT